MSCYFENLATLNIILATDNIQIKVVRADCIMLNAYMILYVSITQVAVTMAMNLPMNLKYIRWSGLTEEAGLICRL